MVADVVNMFIGLAVGVLTGFFFERRSSAAARAHARELEAQLTALRASVYTVGGRASAEHDQRRRPQVDLAATVLEKARSMQNAEGRLSRTLLTSHFFAADVSATDIDAAISDLCSEGKARVDGKWLEVLS